MPVNRIEPARYNGDVNGARHGAPFRISRNSRTREQEDLPRGKNRCNNDEDVYTLVRKYWNIWRETNEFFTATFREIVKYYFKVKFEED